MKTAREMFEELGYKIYEIYQKHVCYNKEVEINNIIFLYIITFKDKTYHAYQCTEEDYGDDGITIDMKLFKAIQKQLEELGWLDE